MKKEEMKLQKECVKWFKVQYPHTLIHHSPNGGYRTPKEGAMFKVMGTLAGFPDLFIAAPRNGYSGLFVEMKTEKGQVSPTQKNVMEMLECEGYRCEVIRDFDHFKNAVENYLDAPDAGLQRARRLVEDEFKSELIL